MSGLSKTAVGVLLLHVPVCLSSAGGECDFGTTAAASPDFFWDESCTEGSLGCKADGKNMACRSCGAAGLPECPPPSCDFANEPFMNYYWDDDCHSGMLGCWADGIHQQCRFCGDAPFTQVPCPELVRSKRRSNATCSFDRPAWAPTYWDGNCTEGMLGCMADGVHEKCRFCAIRPFEDIPCPEGVAMPERCIWPDNVAPLLPFFWDDECELGQLGCWADGIHPQCRFCGRGPFATVACPNGEGGGVTSEAALGQEQVEEPEADMEGDDDLDLDAAEDNGTVDDDAEDNDTVDDNGTDDNESNHSVLDEEDETTTTTATGSLVVGDRSIPQTASTAVVGAGAAASSPTTTNPADGLAKDWATHLVSNKSSSAWIGLSVLILSVASMALSSLELV